MSKINLIIMFIIFSCYAITAQWVQTPGIPQGAGVTDMVVLQDGTIIVTTASFNWPNGQPGGIRRSTDVGNTWQNINNIYNARTLWLGSTGRIFASYWPYPSFEGAYYSTNNGVSWNLLLTLSGTNNIFSIASKNNDSTVFLGTRDGVLRTTNNGNSFINLTNGFPANSWIRDLAITPGGTVIAATTNGAFYSTNNGNLWLAVTGILPGDTVTSVSVDTASVSDGSTFIINFGSSQGNLYFAQQGVNGQIFVTQQSLIALNTEIIVPRNPHPFDKFIAALSVQNASNGGAYHSSNGGVNWSQFREGMTRSEISVLLVRSLCGSDNVSSLELYCGMFENTDNGAKIFKRNFPIGIKNISGEIPNRFSLSQNYPNPFNPNTKIRFSIAPLPFGEGPVRKDSFGGAGSRTKLIIYDILGREISTLVNEQLKPGTYEVDWGAANYPSGVYFYKLVVGDNTNNGGFIETKRMVLIK